MPVWFWIAVTAALLAGSMVSRAKNKRVSASGMPFRIDHPHYSSEDECECSKCGARFRDKVMECPKCGARFCAAREDDGEFIAEMEKREGNAG